MVTVMVRRWLVWYHVKLKKYLCFFYFGCVCLFRGVFLFEGVCIVEGVCLFEGVP